MPDVLREVALEHANFHHAKRQMSLAAGAQMDQSEPFRS